MQQTMKSLKVELNKLQILVYQSLVTEQVTDDTEVMMAELKVTIQIADLKLVIELLGLIRDFLMVVACEEMSEEKQCFRHHL
ncbi:hypothetical protein EMCRGX_G007856 [Ephydatia muelleri]